MRAAAVALLVLAVVSGCARRIDVFEPRDEVPAQADEVLVTARVTDVDLPWLMHQSANLPAELDARIVAGEVPLQPRIDGFHYHYTIITNDHVTAIPDHRGSTLTFRFSRDGAFLGIRERWRWPGVDPAAGWPHLRQPAESEAPNPPVHPTLQPSNPLAAPEDP
ncbi:MAG TPA: hypothetical protein VEL07_19570 [Planctomycetota bacterium]|nr:hypothetical protein [Planctomycetota bacterium]